MLGGGFVDWLGLGVRVGRSAVLVLDAVVDGGEMAGFLRWAIGVRCETALIRGR